MKSKKILLCSAAFGSAAMISLLALGQGKGSPSSLVRGETSSFSMSFTSSKNKLHTYTDNKSHSGQTTLKTNLGNSIKFSYYRALGSSTNWQNFDGGGYFYNLTPIHGLSSITLSFSSYNGPYKILYSRDLSFDQSKEFTITETATQTFDFNGYQPNYFKVVNTDDDEVYISSISISFSCIDNYVKLSVSSENTTMGTVSGAGVMIAGEKATVTATKKDGYSFFGWYSGDTLVSKANPYVFTMPTSDLSLKAKFITETKAKELFGISPVIDTENNTLTYGLYPQERVSDSATLASLNKLTSNDADSINGWYTLNGDYYAKTVATPFGTGYTFDDGTTTIVSGQTYWFKCEPITWKILTSSSNVYSLVSTRLLDVRGYNDVAYWTGKNAKGYYANNYEQSGIRAWLNGTFYKSAFCLDKSLIQTTTVDNSTATTYCASSSNVYACSNTKDNVYLLSYKDYNNEQYFADSDARQCKTTDWARANGAYSNTRSAYLYNGYYWTRSPSYKSSYHAWPVLYGGDLYEYIVGGSDFGVRPAITIKIA